MLEVVTDNRVASITLDECSLVRCAPEIERERQTAIADLLADNQFTPTCVDAGPYDLFLSVRDNRLLLRITSPRMEEPRDVVLPIRPFKQIVKDYFLICESHMEALQRGESHKIEAIDMGRRGIHNEGSQLLKEQLSERINIDFDTARRLFTLICVLHLRA